MGITNSGPIIGLGVRLTEQKGIAYLLQAMPEVVKKFPDITLVIAGEGLLEDELKRESNELGIDEEKLDEFFTVLSGFMNIEFKGLHVFAGSQVLDYKLLLACFENVLKIAINIQKNYPVSVSILNFGGGFGIPYFAKEEELDIQSFGKGLKELFKKNDVKTAFPETRFVVESGRFLVGESGLYITKVLYRKESRGKEYIITEGGMNHHYLAASGLLEIL